MKLSLRATMIVCAIFAAICLSVAVTGFSSLGSLTDPSTIADAKGFAWFWCFLGSVASLLGLLAWRLASRSDESEDT
ncbi:MAG TPA: hypothetical protein VMN79_11795 [Casimicrobiaceae bacterium]|nr:hypothetical protein [Casimicrobiaceae bacterium]